MNIIKNIAIFTIYFAKFLKSIIAICLILLILYIIYYLVSKNYPQLFFICRSDSFSSYMDKFYQEFREHVKTISEYTISTNEMIDIHEKLSKYNLKETLGKIRTHIETINTMTDTELMYVFKYWNALKDDNPSFLSKIDLKGLDSEYLLDDEYDANNEKLKRLFTFRKTMGELRNELETLRNEIDSKEFSSKLSFIFGCIDPIKLNWTKLILKDEVKSDFTLYNIQEKLKGLDITPDQVWETHLSKEGCPTLQPLSNNERIYIEIMDYCKSITNESDKSIIISYIDKIVIKEESGDLVINESAFKDSQEIMNVLMSVYDLDLKLNYYMYDIRYGYDTRKAGWKFNFVFLSYYVWPYIQWIYVIKIGKQTWVKFPFKFKEAMLTFLEWWITLPEMLAKLPLSLAGEGFEQHVDKDYKYFNVLLNIFGKRDTVEHFGFLKGLLSIGKFFASILDVAKALVFMISQPLKFLMMLIGFVIALSIMIIYILITVTGIHYLFSVSWAMITVLLVYIFITLFYVLISIGPLLLLIILWVFDLLTGGLIMALFRCENHPEKWYKYASYADGNMYLRYIGILCAYKCAERYKPSMLLIFPVCKRLQGIQPSFCPQQNIYKIFKDERVSDPYYFQEFEINLKVANMTHDERLSYLKKIRRLREDFNRTCKECYEDDAKFNDSNMLDGGNNYNHISKLLCKYTGQLSNNDSSQLKKICNICNTMYGGDLPIYEDKITFNTTHLAKENAMPNEDTTSFNDPFIKGLSLFISVIILMLFLSFIISKYDIDDKFYEKINKDGAVLDDIKKLFKVGKK